MTQGLFARVEPMEQRLLLVGTALETFDLQPRKTTVADGFGNHLSAIVPAVLAFETEQFGRLNTTHTVLDAAGLGLQFSLLRDVDGSGTQSAADQAIASPGATGSFDLDAGDYLYIITPTTGPSGATASVRVTLQSELVGPASIEVTGNQLVIGDGDVNPSLDDGTNFGTVPVGVLNVDRTFTVRNTGGANLTLGAIGVPAGFAVKAGLPPVLAPGTQADFTLTLSTQQPANREGVVSIRTNDAVVGTMSFVISASVDANALPAKSGLQRLRINGTAGNDTIELTQNATRIIFGVNGNLYSVLKSKIQRGISVDAQTGDDLITVAPDITQAVLIVGAGGDDSIVGGGGNDTLMGLDGDDTLRGGGGADLIDGGDGSDFADYTDKRNGVSVTLDGVQNDGNTGEFDHILGNVENVLGSSGNDTIVGTDGPNFLNSGGGNDFILGLGGNDTMFGGAGDDTLRPGTGDDLVRGQAGADTADYADRTAPVVLSNDDNPNDGVEGEADNIGTDIERFIGGSAGDFIEMFVPGGIAFGLGGDDKLFGTLGNDQLHGGDGNDTLFDGEGNDLLDGGAGNDEASGGFGNDIVRGGPGNDNINGGPGHDLAEGDDGNDSVGGGSGDDIVRGGAGDDQVYGFYVIPHDTDALFRPERPEDTNGEGIDQLFGDGGNDFLDSKNSPNTRGPTQGQIIDEIFPDTLDGGDGTDTVNVDAIDVVVNVP